MTPILHAPYFAFTSGVSTWSRMAAVLEHTAKQHCPDWEIHVDRVDLMDTPDINTSANALKLHEWTRRVLEAPDGARLLLMDTDMFIMAPLDGIWDGEFDIAFTCRPERMASKSARVPLNGGVVAVNVSQRTRDFFLAWQGFSAAMVKDRRLHKQWERRFAGQNQAALGALLAEKPALAIKWLDCAHWNGCEPEWPLFPVPRIIHLKGALRRLLFIEPKPRQRAPRELNPILAYWRVLEQEAKAPHIICPPS